MTVNRMPAASNARRKSPAQCRAMFARYLKRRHGLTVDAYDDLYAASAARCQCCGLEPLASGYSQSVQFGTRKGPINGAARILVLSDRLALVCPGCHTAAMALDRDAARAESLRNLLTGSADYALDAT